MFQAVATSEVAPAIVVSSGEGGGEQGQELAAETCFRVPGPGRNNRLRLCTQRDSSGARPPEGTRQCKCVCVSIF